MDKIVCVLYDDPSAVHPKRTLGMVFPSSSLIRTARLCRRPRGSTSHRVRCLAASRANWA
jgi:hypothetical protein